MKRIALAVIAAGALVAGAGGSLYTGPALAAAPSNGCPNYSENQSGYQLLWVPTLTAEGYHAPALVDSPTSGVLSYGQPGNGDNWVCGAQLGNQLTSFGLPVYNFVDNQLPA